MYRFFLPFVVTLFVALPFASAQKKKNPVYLDPAKAGIDWQLQGEYIGVLPNKQKLGAEVIAKGDGNFVVNFLPGGLRGDGGNYGKRIVAKGKRQETEVTITGAKSKYAATILTAIKGNIMKGKTDTGEAFTLRKMIRKSDTLGKQAPKDAVVLYNGAKDATSWNNGKVIAGNLLGNGCTSKKRFKDHSIHLEFRLSFMPTRGGQGRSNSGVYVQGRYEIQVLDSFGLAGKSNECGGIYSVGQPKVNMCFPPLTWQTYDIDFRAARYDASGKKTKNATVTVRHNGVVIHDQTELKRGVTGGNRLKESTEPGPLYLQGHGGQVQYRNIWVVTREDG